MMHFVAAAIHAGVDFSIWEYDRIRRSVPIPDLFDYSLTAGRTIFELASQCCSGSIRGMETLVYELGRNGVPMNLDAPTATGTTWGERLSDTSNLSAEGVKDNPIILARPRRAVSGVDVLTGNFFESAVVKISGMQDSQLNEFDRKLSLVLYYENEMDANGELLDPHLLESLHSRHNLTKPELLRILEFNTGAPASDHAQDLGVRELLVHLLAENILKLSIVISGQGPEAFGMPEMFTPMQHVNANRKLKKLAMIITDGRYSGVSYGAAIGHVSPEAASDGGILYLRTGDLIQSNLRDRTLQLIDIEELRASGEIKPMAVDVRQLRSELRDARLARIRERAKVIVPTNRLRDVTDAARGVVPRIVAEALLHAVDSEQDVESLASAS